MGNEYEITPTTPVRPIAWRDVFHMAARRMCGLVDLWSGVLWSGVVWCGVVWSGGEWSGGEWSGVEWCGVVKCWVCVG